MDVEARLERLGLSLPHAPQMKAGLEIPFAWARTYRDRVFLSGQGPLAPDGAIVGPFGRVGREISIEAAREAARSATLALISALKREVGDLDRVAAWLTVSGMVNTAPGFTQTTHVINPCSEILLAVFGEEVGRHARTAIGMAQLPLDLPVVLAAEVAIGESAVAAR